MLNFFGLLSKLPSRLPGMVEPLAPKDSTRNARKKCQQYLSDRSVAKLHLGCGEKKFDEWLNIDIGGAADLIWDLNEPLTFLPQNSFDYCYSEHVLEHFPRPVGFSITKQVFAALKPGGVFRVALPDLDRVIRLYNEGYSHAMQAEINSQFREFYGDVFYTRAEYLDICMLGWGHSYLYNEEDLAILLRKADFSQVYRVEYRQSNRTELSGIETRPPEQSALIFEAIK